MLEDLTHKINFLNRSNQKIIMNDLSKIMKETLDEICQESWARGSFRAIILDVQYFFFRHFTWCQDALFPQIVKDYLGEQYLFTDKQSDELLSTVYSTLGLEASDDLDESQFLRYLIVTILTQVNPRETLSDLGVSNRFYGFVTDSIRSAAAPKAYHTPESSPSHLGEEISQIVRDLLEKRPSQPWILEVEKLAYSLQMTPKSAQKVFHLLLTIGKSKDGMSKKSCQEAYDQFPLTDFTWEQLVNLLVDQNLLFESPKGRTTTIHLSQEGYDLTSTAFATQFFRKNHGNRDAIHSVPGSYQKPLLLRIAQQDPNECLEILSQSGQHLQPKALKGAIIKLARGQTPHEEVFASIHPLCGSSKSTFVQKALVEAMAHLQDPRVKPTLEKIAQTATTSGLKAATLDSLASLSH